MAACWCLHLTPGGTSQGDTTGARHSPAAMLTVKQPVRSSSSAPADISGSYSIARPPDESQTFSQTLWCLHAALVPHHCHIIRRCNGGGHSPPAILTAKQEFKVIKFSMGTTVAAGRSMRSPPSADHAYTARMGVCYRLRLFLAATSQGNTTGRETVYQPSRQPSRQSSHQFSTG